MLSLRPASATAALSPAERARAPARGPAHAPAPAGIVHTGVAGVVDGVSTVAIAGGDTLSSIPAALCRMRDIAVVSSSGVLTEVDQAKLRSEYGQLSQQVAEVVGSSVPHGATEAADSDRAGRRKDGTAGAPPDAVPGATSAPGTPGTAVAPPAESAPAAVQHSALSRPAALAHFHRQQAPTPRPELSVRA